MELAEVAADRCAEDASQFEYRVDLHVMSLFVIMSLSLLGTLLPVLSQRLRCFGQIRDLPFQTAKMFGAGVILATAFVHMFSPADQALSNPCLPEFFTSYTSWAGAIALFAALFVHFIQFMASRTIHRQNILPANPKSISATTGTHAHPHPPHDHHHPNHQEQHRDHHDFSSNSHSTLDHITDPESGITSIEHDHSHGLLLSVKEKHVTTYILELGIASHSIIIGLALGVARGPEFQSLLIALGFHHFFEGLALSAVVMESGFKRGGIIFMVLLYTLTTPIGIALGIGLNSKLNESATAVLITTGILDSLAAGILTYDVLVNVIFPHFNASFLRQQSDVSQYVQVAGLWFGAFTMAFIGKWA